MLEHPVHPALLEESDNASGAYNQQGSRRRQSVDPSETTRRASFNSNVGTAVAIAYLQGALGDGTFNVAHDTYRIGQNEIEWLRRLQQLLQVAGNRSWIYREGKTRRLHVLETTAKWLSRSFNPETLQTVAERIAYIRGYFDAEGGIPQQRDARFYVQFVQKNRGSLERVQRLLEPLEISCGKLHNPSARADPDYWRFFVRAQSYERFVQLVGSWHPRKAKLLSERMKI